MPAIMPLIILITMDIIKEIEILYNQLPQVACRGCGQCCVSPTTTLAEFIFLMHHMQNVVPQPIIEEFIFASPHVNTVHEGNIDCSLLRQSKCTVHPWRSGACRLFGIPSLDELGVSNLVSCFNNISVTSGQYDKPFIMQWLDSLVLLNKSLYSFGKEPYFIYGFNLECWLDIYFDELIADEVFCQIRNIMKQHFDLSAFAPRYAPKTGLKDKIDKINILTMLIDTGDKDSIRDLCISIRDDYPLTGTYFTKEAETFLTALE